jgi:tRNA1(Val) A37 N6-methylase TrmN6
VILARHATGTEQVQFRCDALEMVAEYACLALTDTGQLIVILLPERGLAVTDEINDGHLSLVAISLVMMNPDER